MNIRFYPLRHGEFPERTRPRKSSLFKVTWRTVLAAFKITYDLDAFTEQSKRRVDLFAFFLIGLVLIVLALALPTKLSPIEIPCYQVCGWTVL